MSKDRKLDLWVYLGIPAVALAAGLSFTPPLTYPAMAGVMSASQSPVVSTVANTPETAMLSMSNDPAPIATSQSAISASPTTPSSLASPATPASTGAPEPAYTPAPQSTSDLSVDSDPTITDKRCVLYGRMSYSDLRQCLDAKKTSITGITTYNGSNDIVAHSLFGDFVVTVPDTSAKVLVAEKAVAHNLSVDSQDPPFNLLSWLGNNIWLVLIVASIGLTLFLSWRQRKQMMNGSSGGIKPNMTKNKAKDFKAIRKGKRLTFDDIRGCDEAVEHGKRIIEMHEHQPVFRAHKAPFPRGFLLVGPPGVGKTHWVRVLADVLDGDVFITAGSEFVEMYVGVGASRARDLVEQAKARARESTKPVLVMIDEIDAVAGRRGGSGGGNDERESTLNQLLVEMDGLEELDNIIFIGATNLPEKLDPAILRRLANRIVIDLPDLKGRGDIIDLYIKDMVLATDVSVPALAKSTYSLSGDQLKKGIEYAAGLAAQRCVEQRKANKVNRFTKIDPVPATMEDFSRAFDYIMHGDELPSKQAGLTVLNKRNTALHEACHLAACVVFHKLGWIDKAVKATIMRRSRTLGFVMTMPEEERTGWDHRQCLARMIMAMAGRAGQEIFLDTRDSGASSDFQMATDMAREMVMKWGMSDLGAISVGSRIDGSSVQTGLSLADKMDQAWTDLCNQCLDIARQLVTAEVKFVKVVTLILEEKETILEAEIDRLAAAIPSEFDVSALDCFNKLAAFKEHLFDNCDVGSVEQYLQLAAPALEAELNDNDKVSAEAPITDATTPGVFGNGEDEGSTLTEGTLS